MKKYFTIALRLTFISFIFFCGFYTLVILGIAHLTKYQGEGETIEWNGKKQYINIAQRFTGNQYFMGRPSSVNYNAAAAGGSNKGPSNPEYLDTVQARLDQFIIRHPGVQKSELPSEMVTASGSGLDPHISIQAARLQMKRVAAARNMPVKEIQNLIEKHVERPLLELFGPAKINVLKLNIELDNLHYIHQ